MDDADMRVTKRSGATEVMAFDKILTRVKTLNLERYPCLSINSSKLVIKIIEQLYDGIDTTKIDELTAHECAAGSVMNPDLGILAGRIIVSNNHKNTDSSLEDVVYELHNACDVHTRRAVSLVSEEYHELVRDNGDIYMDMIDFDRDYYIDYFGFKTLERAYLLRVNGKIVERPQHMWMRVAIAIHRDDFERVKETYDMLSNKFFTHATPTLFNAGTPRQQMSSCYLLAMHDDSIDGIYKTLTDCAKISKWAGGIGLHVHNVRAAGTHIQGTNGTSNGLVPMLRNFNETARYVDQGGGKRNGSFAIYLSPEHPDIEAWLDLKKNTGDENARARDLFYGLWVPDLFMLRVKNDLKWSLFCPHKCPGLQDVHGDEYTKLYLLYESEDRQNRKISARALWLKILDAQMETGTPYLLYKDAANAKSNQKNLGTIKSSNLCTEILEYSDKEETAVCNLASIGLPKFVTHDKKFDFDSLHYVTGVVVNNLNTVIDINYYPTENTRRSNLNHRPIGVGVQGLADVFIMLNIPYHSEEAKQLNRDIFETMYHSALEMSKEIAMKRHLLMMEFISCLAASARSAMDNRNIAIRGKLYNPLLSFEDSKVDDLYHRLQPIYKELCRDSHLGSYSSFVGSPLSEGKFQFDLWGATPSARYDWDTMREGVMRYGIRNSLLIAPMPTASTSQILGNNECFEPITSNIYTRRTLAGEFVVANKYLIRELMALGMWNEKLKDNIIENRGSIQHLEDIPETIRNKYKIVWEIPMKHLIDMSRDRGAFICQSQSLNLWVEDPSYKVLTAMHFYGWEQGLKTGIYYLRRKPKHQVQQFTIEPEKSEGAAEEDEICEACGA